MMKLKMKVLVLVGCLGLFTGAFAAGNQHEHPQAHSEASQAGVKAIWPGSCEIEIINQSYDDVRVYGVFDDLTTLSPFYIYSREAPHYVSLYYYGYCHAGMNVYIDTLSGYRVYAGYTLVDSTVRIVPFLTNQVKAQVTAKK